MIEEAFEVATEFRFDVGQAVLGTNQITGAVDDLNQAAGNAMTSLQYLAGGLVAHLGIGSGGLLGVLTKAFKASEEFTSDTANFASNIGGNFQYLAGHINGFNEQLESSRTILGDIGRVAKANGLSRHDLSATVRTIAGPMAKHEKLGTNYAGGISLAKNMMLAGESTGVGSRIMTETIARAMTDNMSIHGAVFQRLVGTKAFTDMHIRNQGQLQHMEGGRKIDLLTKAMEQLAGGASFAAYRLNLISVQFQILKENLVDVLKPIGDAIIMPLKKIFGQVNVWLGAHGAEIGGAIGKVIGDIFGDPEKLYINVRQLMAFKGDFRRAMDWTSIGLLSGSVLSFFKKTRGLGSMIEGWMGVKEGSGFIAILSSDAAWFAKIFKIIGSSLSEFLPNVAALTFLFQILSRARAKAQISDAKDLLEMSPKFLNAFVKFKTGLANVMLPLTLAIEQLSDWCSWVFKTSILVRVLIYIFEALADKMEGFGNMMIRLLALMSGQMQAVMGFTRDSAAGHPLEAFKNLMPNFKEGYDMFTKLHQLSGPGTPSPQSIVTNNNHVTARFDMREQLEPDRVAFAVTEHLKKLTISATQGKGHSLHSGFAQQKTAGVR